MKILAFDTSMAACSVVLWDGGAVRAAARETMERGQAEALMPMIEAVMADGGMAYAALDRIAVTVGPGSFTGVRVGLAAARGLGLAAGKPVVGVLTTHVLAAAVDDEHVLAAIDTKRGDLYVQRFLRAKPESGPFALAPSALRAWIGEYPVTLVGDGAAIARETLGPSARIADAVSLPDAAVLARLAESITTFDAPLPVYVHAPAVTVSR